MPLPAGVSDDDFELSDDWYRALPPPTAEEVELMTLVEGTDLSDPDQSKWTPLRRRLCQMLGYPEDEWDERVGAAGARAQKQLTNRYKQKGVVGVETTVFVVGDPKIYGHVVRHLTELVHDDSVRVRRALIVVRVPENGYRIATVIGPEEA